MSLIRHKYLFYLIVGFIFIDCLNATINTPANSTPIVKTIIISGDSINLYESDFKGAIHVSTNDFVEFLFFNEADTAIQKYRTQLIGFDNHPSSWTLKNSRYYRSLPNGQYTFYVESIKKKQQISIIVKSDTLLSRYITSSIILLVLVVLALFILRFIYSKNSKPAALSKKQNTITPLLKKYLSTDSKITTDLNKTLHKGTVKYDKVTVLFADIQGFTKIVEHLNPETLIDELDRFFIHFDEVADKYKIEKIKTIGDAYMCAGGLPEKNGTNPIEVVLAAIEMQRFMKKTNASSGKEGKDFWELRIGIHTGPVISGVIGRKKLSFDIWGDTVNIASRMESSGVAGKINVSGITYNLIKDFFVCEYRGKMPIKYKGETDMYFVKSIVPELSIDGKGESPNENFFTKLQWIRYNDIEELVLNQLKNELPSTLKYHNIKHTLDVCTQVEVIGRAEGLTSKELLLVKTAALFHDTGYMISPLKHEIQSVRIAREVLPGYNFTKTEIEAISQLIMVTEKSAQPRLLMEKIIKDADLDYLGRADFIPLSEKLWEEESLYNGKISQKDWNKKQHEFLSKHVYYTNTAKNLRQVNKDIQLKKIKEVLKQ